MIELVLPFSPRCAGVYRIDDARSGRFYIGSSVNMQKRWIGHQRRLEAGDHPNPALQAIYNADPMRLSMRPLLPTLPTREALLKAEQFALDEAGVGRNPFCLNVLAIAGSHLGRKRSAETCARLSAAQTGKRHTSESRARMSAAAKNRPPISDATRAKLSANQRGRRHPGRKHSGPRPELRRFTDEQVRAIRALKAGGASFAQIEERFEISRGALQRMLARATYAEVLS